MRNESISEQLSFNRPISIGKLALLVADKAQKCTQEYGGRPYGVGLLLAGYDSLGPHIFEISPTGNYDEYYAMAIGARSQPSRTVFEENLESIVNSGLFLLAYL